MSKKVLLKPEKSASIFRKHPWIFSGAIDKMDKGVRDGDRVEVQDTNGDFLAIGHYQSEKSIAVRIISFEPISDIKSFWVGKINQAFQYRKVIGIINDPTTNCYRLVHAEGDGLPGLIIDIYHQNAVIQCHSIGMHKALPNILSALQEIYSNSLRNVYNKSKSSLPTNYSSDLEDGYLLGDNSSCPATVLENGISFEVNWETGQKTGFFLDQRDNRQHMMRYVEGKKVLNAFSYSGAFSIYALKAGAKEVHSVDVSSTATDLVDRNLELNKFTSAQSHQSITDNVMHFLKTTEHTYDVMIIDPPAFAKSIKKRHNAIQAYKGLNALAMKRVNPGGIISTYSCSQVVDKALFYNTIRAAALEAGKSVRVLVHLSQPADHPVSLFHDQSGYLKGLVLYVE